MAIETYQPRDRGATAALTRYAKFAKGKRNERGLPTDTSHFNPRLTEKYAARLKAVWSDFFVSDTPHFVSGLYLITDNVHDDVCYQRSFEFWGKNFLVKRCNGSHIEKIANPAARDNNYAKDTPTHLFYTRDPENPIFQCERGDKISCLDDLTKRGCRLKGRLRLRYPALTLAAGLPDGYIEFEHGAFSDDASILSGLNYIQSNWANRYGLPLSAIPLMIYREAQPVAGNTKHVICLSVDTERAAALGITERPETWQPYQPTPTQPAPPASVIVPRAPVFQSPQDRPAVDPFLHNGKENDLAASLRQQFIDTATMHLPTLEATDAIQEFHEWLGQPAADFTTFVRWDDLCEQFGKFAEEMGLPLSTETITTESYDKGKRRLYILDGGFVQARVYSRSAFKEALDFDFAKTDIDRSDGANENRAINDITGSDELIEMSFLIESKTHKNTRKLYWNAFNMDWL